MLFDGYKRHVLHDLDTGLVPAVGITPTNPPEASVTDDITADLAVGPAAAVRVAHRPGLPVRGPVPRPGPDLAVCCKAWRIRNAGGRFAKDRFTLDFAAGQLTCPAGMTMPSSPARPSASPKPPARPARCGPVHQQQQRAQRGHPPRRCAARRTAPPPEDPRLARSCANASSLDGHLTGALGGCGYGTSGRECAGCVPVAGGCARPPSCAAPNPWIAPCPAAGARSRPARTTLTARSILAGQRHLPGATRRWCPAGPRPRCVMQPPARVGKHCPAGSGDCCTSRCGQVTRDESGHQRLDPGHVNSEPARYPHSASPTARTVRLSTHQAECPVNRTHHGFCPDGRG